MNSFLISIFYFYKLLIFQNSINNILTKFINPFLKGEKKLNDEVIHLLFSANRWEMKDQLIQNL